MRKRLKVSQILVLLFALCFLGSARGWADSVYGDFSSTKNPNGVWSYEWNGTTVGFQTATWYGQAAWWNGQQVPSSISIIQGNASGPAVSHGTITIPDGYLNLDPENGTVAIQFTAPTSGWRSINGNFFGDDTGENSHPVEILLNGTVIWSNTISKFDQEDLFSLSEDLKAGDTLTFEVLTGSSGCTYCNLSTGLELNVPEPSVLALLTLGLVG